MWYKKISTTTKVNEGRLITGKYILCIHKRPNTRPEMSEWGKVSKQSIYCGPTNDRNQHFSNCARRQIWCVPQLWSTLMKTILLWDWMWYDCKGKVLILLIWRVHEGCFGEFNVNEQVQWDLRLGEIYAFLLILMCFISTLNKMHTNFVSKYVVQWVFWAETLYEASTNNLD